MKIQLMTALILCLHLASCGGPTERTSATVNTNSSTAVSTPSGGELNASEPTITTITSGKNLLAFGAGAMIVSQTSEADSLTSARRLIDEGSFFWMSADGQLVDQTVTIELPTKTTLKTLVFDTSQATYYDHRSAKDVTVEVSDSSATDGFQTILSASLKDDSDNQQFPVEREIAGRFVRLTAMNNHGSKVAILMREIRGYGDQESLQTLPNVSGTYSIESYGELHLKQEGTSITGCYNYEEGVVTGGIEGRTLTLNWTQRGNTKGFAAVNFTDGGRKFLSAWWSGISKSYDSAWKGEKKTDQVGSCPNWNNESAQDQLEKSLNDTGRAALYGINFDFNSDNIRDESKPTIEQVLALLRKHADWKLQIEGHTDNIGSQTFNQTLSERRAMSVTNYLISAGIDAARLSSKGFGLSKPVATNDSEAGRAQNRRVELIKQ